MSKQSLFDDDFDLKPIVKWAGGKRRIMHELINRMPDGFIESCADDDNDNKILYVEPFTGSASVLFELTPCNVIINDVNMELMNMYQQVKDNPNDVISMIKSWPRDKNTYLRIRSLDRVEDYLNNVDSITRAARFIYLNKTCFNGLYRVNRDGFFNVAYAETQTTIPDYGNIINVSKYLNDNNVTVMNDDYSDVFDYLNNTIIPKHDYDNIFVYIDPPYDYDNEDYFDKYDSNGFGRNNQKGLYEEIIKLIDNGNRNDTRVYIMESNNDTEFITSLYSSANDGHGSACMFNIDRIMAFRSISADKNKRGKTNEVIIRNYES